MVGDRRGHRLEGGWNRGRQRVDRREPGGDPIGFLGVAELPPDAGEGREGPLRVGMLEPELFLVDRRRLRVVLRGSSEVTDVVGDDAEAVVGGRQIRAPPFRMAAERGDLLFERFPGTGPILETGPRGADLTECRGGVDRLRARIDSAIVGQHRTGPIEGDQRVAPAVECHEAVAEDRQRVPVAARADEGRRSLERTAERGERIDRLLGAPQPVVGLPLQNEQREDLAVVLPLRRSERPEGFVDEAKGLGKPLAAEGDHSGRGGASPRLVDGSLGHQRRGGEEDNRKDREERPAATADREPNRRSPGGAQPIHGRPLACRPLKGGGGNGEGGGGRTFTRDLTCLWGPVYRTTHPGCRRQQPRPGAGTRPAG